MDESRTELKVGILAVITIAAVVTLLVLMGELNFSNGAQLTVDFGHTGNVVKNAPVKLAGVAVGHVERIELLPDRQETPVQMTLWVQPEVSQALKRDAQVTVSSQGPLGEAYLELWVGTEAQHLDLGTAIRGTDAPRIDVVSNRLARFLDSAASVLDKDPEALSKLVRGVGGLSTTVDGVLTENRDSVKDLATDLAAAAKDLRLFAATARVQLEPGGKANALIDDAAATVRLARNDLPQISTRASIALGGLAAVAGPLNADDGKRLKATFERVESAGEKLETLATRADRLLAKMEAGEGTLGAFMKDKQAYEDLKSLLADLRKHPWKMLWKD